MLSFNLAGVDFFGLSLSFSYTSCFFSFCLLIIYIAIFLFSLNYFGVNADFARFSLIFLSFVVSMLLLINHSRVFLLFIGWDGLGLRSYFLVAYYINWSSINGAIVTVLSNRFGDFCLLWFFSLVFGTGIYLSWMIPFLLILGLSTKSAQFPFRRWLPLAIAAPTPVSSLVHRRTLVTAGYYLMFCYYNFLTDSSFLFFITFLGTVTIFLSGLSSLFENDLKKVIALSTLSQMGFLVISLGLGLPILSFLHIISHAFFKSCIFIQVGMLIFLSFSSQESRAFRRLCVGNPALSFLLVTCTLRLCGQLFLRGFFRKEPVLLMSSSSSLGVLLMCIIIIGVMFTFLYRTRILFGVVSPSPIRVKISLKIDFLFFSIPLWFLGLFSGYFSLQNRGLFLFGFVFLEKIIIVFLPLSALIIVFSYFGSLKYARGMILLDYVTSRFRNVLLKRLKSADFFFISAIKLYYFQASRLSSIRRRNFLVFNFNLILWGGFLLVILL